MICKTKEKCVFKLGCDRFPAVGNVQTLQAMVFNVLIIRTDSDLR